MATLTSGSIIRLNICVDCTSDRKAAGSFPDVVGESICTCSRMAAGNAPTIPPRDSTGIVSCTNVGHLLIVLVLKVGDIVVSLEPDPMLLGTLRDYRKRRLRRNKPRAILVGLPEVTKTTYMTPSPHRQNIGAISEYIRRRLEVNLAKGRDLHVDLLLCISEIIGGLEG